MAVAQTFNELLQATSLRHGATDARVKDIQQGLYEMGFGKELKWNDSSPHEEYDDATADALDAFAEKNNLDEDDGTELTPLLAKKLQERYQLLQSLLVLYKAIQHDRTAQVFELTRADDMDNQLIVNALRELGLVQERTTLQAALTEFAQLENIAFDGTTLDKKLATVLFDCLAYYYGDDFKKVIPLYDSLKANLNFETKDSGTSVGLEQEKVFFKNFRKGFYTKGRQNTANFIAAHRDAIRALDVSDDAINVMIAVSENEGNFDAINTWDGAFLSFGIFQWTLGMGSAEGELAALLKKIKQRQPDIFYDYFGKFGIDVHPATNTTLGFLNFRGERVQTIDKKELFRQTHRAFRFWLAGQHPAVNTIQVEHAISRLKNFYWKVAVHGHTLEKIVNSQYGVGLILDHHVNRPGHVKLCLEQAMGETNLIHENPMNWTTEDEQRLLDAYLDIRATYSASPMTDSTKRALVTKKYVRNGTISAERRSFQYANVRAFDDFPALPFDYDAADYPMIRENKAAELWNTLDDRVEN